MKKNVTISFPFWSKVQSKWIERVDSLWVFGMVTFPLGVGAVWSIDVMFANTLPLLTILHFLAVYWKGRVIHWLNYIIDIKSYDCLQSVSHKKFTNQQTQCQWEKSKTLPTQGQKQKLFPLINIFNLMAAAQKQIKSLAWGTVPEGKTAG